MPIGKCDAGQHQAILRHRDELLDLDACRGQHLGADAPGEVELDARDRVDGLAVDKDRRSRRVSDRQSEIAFARKAVRRLVIGDRHAFIDAVQIDPGRAGRLARAAHADKAIADRKQRGNMAQLRGLSLRREAPRIARKPHGSKGCFR